MRDTLEDSTRGEFVALDVCCVYSFSLPGGVVPFWVFVHTLGGGEGLTRCPGLQSISLHPNTG